MIHELFGSAGQLIPGSSERKIISVNEGILGSTASPPLPSSPCLSSSTTPAAATSTASTTAAAASSNSENQNLRCPRCDSSNTKFCYYNNYNLTQPRHFCKTCRRYWTKGGALRNVPIGGGCRKNKTAGVSNSAAKATGAAKLKTVASELGRSGLGAAGFDHHELPANPILWGSPQNSHLLALLRANQNQNPNPSPNPNSMSSGVTVKEEGNLMGSRMMTEPLMVANGALSARTRGFDHVEQVPSLGLASSFWRNINQDQTQQQNGGFVLGEHQNSGIQELYQRIRLSSANYCRDNSPLFLNNEPSSSFYSSLSILESAPASGGELGYWNPPLSWSDLPTTGAYPLP